jgi:hypothetical protein
MWTARLATGEYDQVLRKVKNPDGFPNRLTARLDTLKKADLEKTKGKKIDRQMNQSPTPGRFGQGAAAVLDRREQRRRDQALGLVPFAIKLDGDLVKQLHTLARERGTGLNELTAELLKKGLKVT